MNFELSTDHTLKFQNENVANYIVYRYDNILLKFGNMRLDFQKIFHLFDASMLQIPHVLCILIYHTLYELIGFTTYSSFVCITVGKH